jgi:hypothetical protein
MEFTEAYPAQSGMPLESMAKAGIWRIDMGVDSGNDRKKRQVLNRPFNNEVMLRAADSVCRHKKIVSYYFFIIGNPYKDHWDPLETIGLILRLPLPYCLRAHSLVLIPGTHPFQRPCEDGIILGLDDSGCDLEFAAGLGHRAYAWKKYNLYFNNLISLMFGKATRLRIDSPPRKLNPAITAGPIIDI